jgi:sarcosine oxidase
MMQTVDVIVLGLGGIGSGAAYWCARTGARVLGLEQFELGHARGESHDHSRIIRLSYHAEPYVRLAREAFDAWQSVEEHGKTQLVFKTGGLDLAPRNGAIPLEGYANAMRACDVPFEHLSAGEVRRRFPAFKIDDDVRALFQADGGIVAAERATRIHQELARELGATLLDGKRVLSIRNRNGEIEVETAQARYTSRELIVAAGPWSNDVLRHFDVALPLEVTKEQPMYFRPGDPDAFAPGRFPVWIWMDNPSFYGFPIFGEPAVKVTQDAGGKAVDPDARDFEPDPDISERVRAFLRAHLPSAIGEEHLIKTCLYTLTPDRDFVIDTLSEHPNVHVAIGAGHAFKFASVIGRILSELAYSGRTSSAIQNFAIDRDILQMESPPKTYMV